MATYEAQFSTGEKTLTSTTADQITLYGTGAHKLRITNHSGTTPLYVIVNSVGTAPVKAQGTLTIAEQVTADDDMTIGGQTYTFKSTLTGSGNEILLGATEAATKTNIEDVLQNGYTVDTASVCNPGTQPLKHDAADFSTDDMVITARRAGTQGNAIATTETFTHVSNVFDAATLGTTTAGADAVITTATAAEDRFVIPGVVASTSPTSAHVLELNGNQYGISNGQVGISIVGNANKYSAQLLQ